MAEKLDHLVQSRSDTSDALLVLAIVYGKEKIDPAEFWGKSDLIKDAIEDGGQALKTTIAASAHMNWDGKTPFWKFVVNEIRERCICNCVYAQHAVSEGRLEEAIRISKYHDAGIGGVPLANVERAKAVVKSAYENFMGVVQPLAADISVPVESTELEAA